MLKITANVQNPDWLDLIYKEIFLHDFLSAADTGKVPNQMARLCLYLRDLRTPSACMQHLYANLKITLHVLNRNEQYQPDTFLIY